MREGNVVKRWVLPTTGFFMALLLVALVALGVYSRRGGSILLFGGLPYYPESFEGSFPKPYSAHNKLGMVQYMPQNSTAWWDGSES